MDVWFHTHFTKGISVCVSDYYPNYKEALERTGAVTYHTLGNALVYCCDARKMTDVITKIWEKADRDLCTQNEQISEVFYV